MVSVIPPAHQYREIEKKFLVTNSCLPLSQDSVIIQTYIFISKYKELRLRYSDHKYTLGLKVRVTPAIREEYEFEIPHEMGVRLLEIGSDKLPIVKTRYQTEYAGNKWEIDVFLNENEGLILAEIELSSPDQSFDKPSWVGPEVTHDKRYYNSYLYHHPYKSWIKT